MAHEGVEAVRVQGDHPSRGVTAVARRLVCQVDERFRQAGQSGRIFDQQFMTVSRGLSLLLILGIERLEASIDFRQLHPSPNVEMRPGSPKATPGLVDQAALLFVGARFRQVCVQSLDAPVEVAILEDAPLVFVEQAGEGLAVGAAPVFHSQ